MCGIVYIKRKDGKPANRSIRKRYFRQKHRGTSGFGYVAVRDNEVVAYERAPTEHEIMQKLLKETAPEILFHHRFPTSTPNMEEQSHPLFVSHEGFQNQYFFAHNGVIRNASQRKTVHDTMGIAYRTELKPMLQTITNKLYHFGDARFNDSEALAVDTALALEGRVQMIDSEGPAAVVGFIVQGSKVVDRFFYRNHSNPLNYHTDRIMTILSSAGTGKEVDIVHLMRLNEDGTVTEHPIKMWTPYTFRHSDYSGTPARQAPFPAPYQSSGLPGFSGLPRTIDLDDPLDIEIERLGKFEMGEDDTSNLLDYNKSKTDFLRILPDSVLWEEWKRADTTRVQLQAALDKLDTNLLIGEALQKVGLVHIRLEKVKVYCQRIERELQGREGDGSIVFEDESLQGARNQGSITG